MSQILRYKTGSTVPNVLTTDRRYDWVVDLDILGFFDHIDHALLLRAVRKHTNCKWVLLYIERWLRAPIEQEDGSESVRGREGDTAAWGNQSTAC